MYIMSINALIVISIGITFTYAFTRRAWCFSES